MILINLLPYRDAKRIQNQRLFLGGLLLFLIVVGIAYYGLYQIFANRVSEEQAKVAYLQSVSQELDAKIASVADLRKKRDALLAREKTITALQEQRDLTVRIFNSLAAITPNGVFLSSLQQTGNSISLSGYAQGNDQVAEFMRKIEQSTIFEKPTLDIISKAQLAGQNAEQFTLQMQIKQNKTSSEAKK
ncbi:PilN domain-containing protein [Candidatus Igneacidithiobacillus taiwanensis]|uniref:PilN domain-containing protein n=1 Tax=Candidatus Igneacidithiobacillus taiwanensis TaxID=1945924 RepID=UPI00289D0C9C|nr:PilN domain-containing protein [Candidatus Igneacidithiobacillus taiwanensis]MCE5359475.1 PilN domain-containing protein [Acidithiobacillus sp.]